jgi:pilus assembly protein CpaB
MPKVPWPTTAGWWALTAIGSAAVAVLAGRHYLGAREAELRAEAHAGLEGRGVVVAAHALSVGALVGAADLALRQIPARFADSDSLEGDAAGQLLGRRVLHARRAGDTVSLLDVEALDASTLSSHVEAGMRAVTLPVDELGSLSGLLRPGDRVDLYFLPATAGTDAKIGLLFPSVPILATGAQTRTVTAPLNPSLQAAGFASITVQLTPEDAQRLALAQRVGQIVPVLRAGGDASPTAAAIQSARNLLVHPAMAQATPARTRERLSLEVIIGGRGEGVATTDALDTAAVGNSEEGGRP